MLNYLWNTDTRLSEWALSAVKRYDVISIGTGSAMNIIDPMLRANPEMRIAIIDKDEPGGVCLTRGCIPSKILLYPAELVRTAERMSEFGIDVRLNGVDFAKVMGRMRRIIDSEIASIRQGLSQAGPNIDYYPVPAEFIAPYRLRVGGDEITAPMIFLCTGSKPLMPSIKGLGDVGYQTSDTVLRLKQRPKSIAIIGAGYIAAEYGHFFSAMGSQVTIIGRNPRFLREEEPEVSALAKRELEEHMRIITGHEVKESKKGPEGKTLVTVNSANGESMTVTADEIMVAAGRASNSDVLHPERAGIDTDPHGWIKVNGFLETSQPNVWAFGDANGQYQFKHKANYDSIIVYYNAVLKRRMRIDYHAVPHAVFTDPEIAGVGLLEKEAIHHYGEDNVLIGIERYEDTAKGEAMGLKDYFAKVIVEKNTMKILGAHIIGPYASVLIQEIVNLMYTPDRSATPLIHGMHIHPALTEVVSRAFDSLMPPTEYHHVMEHQYGLPAN